MKVTKLLNSLLFKISGNMKCKIIKGEQGQPYLERYMVARWGKNGEHTIFLHRFLDSDSDKGLHDHPWDSRSFILAGGYWERREVQDGSSVKVIVRDIKPFQFNKIGKNDFHRVVLKKKTPVWTLFYHADRQKEWGFKDETTKDFTPALERGNVDNNNQPWEKTALTGKKTERMPKGYLL